MIFGVAIKEQAIIRYLMSKNRLLALATVGVLATTIMVPVHGFGQNLDADSALPPVYGLRDDRTPPLNLTSLEAQLVGDVIAWSNALNRFDYNDISRKVTYPFYIEGRFVDNDEEMQRRLREWFVVNQMPNFRNVNWDLDRVSLIDIDTWVSDPTGARDVARIERLNLDANSYVVILNYQNPNDRFEQSAQTYYVKLDGTTARVAGIWDYAPPLDW